MKTLYLLRHAKSSWDSPGAADRDRPLNKRGRRDAPRMGAALAARMAPIAAHVSPACRAQQTLEGLCAGWPGMAEEAHVTEEALYTFSTAALFEWIAAHETSAQHLFIIGHNPAMTDLVNVLCGAHLLHNLPTAGFAELALHIDAWDALGQGCGELQYRLFPRDLGDS